MRKEKLEQLQDYIRKLRTVKKTLVSSECVYDKDKKFLKEKEFINIEKYMVELGNGMIIPREKILKGGEDKSAVIIMAVTKDNNIVLVVQSRSSTHESVCVEFPAGYIEDGESPEDGAKREMLEETGYVPREMIYLDKFYQDQSCGVCAYNYSYLALGCEKMQEQNLDDNEAIRYFECSIDEVMELVEKGYITDIQTKYTLNLAKAYIYQREKHGKI